MTKCIEESVLQTPVVQRVDIAIHWMDSVIGIINAYPLDSDLSSG